MMATTMFVSKEENEEACYSIALFFFKTKGDHYQFCFWLQPTQSVAVLGDENKV